MDIQTQTSLLAAIITLALAISSVLRGRAHALQLRFAALTFNLFAWHATTFIVHAAGDVGPWYRLALLAGAFLPVTLTWFFLPFVGENKKTTRRVLRSASLATAILLMTVVSPAYHSSWVGALSTLVTFGTVGVCFFYLLRRSRRARSGRESIRLLYLLWGGVVTAVFALADFLPNIGIPSPSVGNVFEIVYLFFVSQSLLLYRLLDLEELIGKGVVLGILATLLATMYAVLTFWVPSGSAVFFFNTVVASFVILILFDPMRSWVENAVNRFLFTEKFHLSQDLLSLRKELARAVDANRVVRALLRAFAESRRVTHAAVYLASGDGRSYLLAGSVGPPAPERFDAVAIRPFVDRLANRREVTAEDIARERRVAAEARRRRGGPVNIEAISHVENVLRQLAASVVIPFIAERTVLGWMALGDQRIKEAYSEAELNMLSDVATQATIAIQNSEAVQRIRERDRLAALGEMAAGLAHEIKNPLSAIKGAAQLVTTSEGAGSKREEGEFLDIIIEEVNRLDVVVSQFLDYARPYKRRVVDPVDVREVLHRTVLMFEHSAREAGLEVELQLPEHLPAVTADAEQLKQVFLNLALNAKEAVTGSAPGGKLTITARSVRRSGLKPMVEVVFADDGPGIRETELPHLFVPFHTTKDGGTGLGLAISQRIVQHHGGRLLVESAQGRGATFTVRLPERVEGEEPATITGEIHALSHLADPPEPGESTPTPGTESPEPGEDPSDLVRRAS